MRPRVCELPTLPTRDLVGGEAGLHGWTGRRVGRSAPTFLRGPVTHNGRGPLRITGPPFHPPASLPAAVRLNDLRIVPSGGNQPQSPVLLSRNSHRDAVSDENRGDFNDWGVGGGSRWRRRARSSMPVSGWTEGIPFLSRWTCRRPWTRSTCSQRNAHSSDALKPCRNAIKIMVASRCPCRLFPAVFMSRSTSRSVRYSRVRYSAFGSRPGGTVLFTVLGVLTFDLDFIDNFPCARPSLFL
jgi:hypothetical protein